MGRLILAAALVAALAAPALAKQAAHVEQGIASMYGGKFVGRTTASGQKLDRTHLTAAHRKLPFGTRLVVTNRRNGRSVVVTVNDRGPHRKGRIIDLSPAAARELGMRRAGLVPVEIRIASSDQ
jgi:peptidoglycan lytic transglycosylase